MIPTPIAEFIFAERPEIPTPVRDYARVLLIDTLGVAAAASTLEVSQIARAQAAASLCAGPGAPSVPLLFDGRPVSPLGMAYAAATQIDNLDAHDGYNLTKGHVSAALVPALIAFAAQLPELTARQALEAYIIGYEVASCAATALHATAPDYHTSGAWNGLGVAAMGARLFGLSVDQLRQALGIAEYHGPRSQMMREIAHPTMLHDGSGPGAQIGVMAVELAQRGFTGAPAITVEGSEVTDHWAGLGSRWAVPLSYVKPYPICRWAHAAIDGLRALHLANGFMVEDVRRIEVRTFAEAAALYPAMPQTTSQAQYSLAFALINQLRFGWIGPAQVSGSALSDPETARMIDLVTVVETPELSARFPKDRVSQVLITLGTGAVLDSGVLHARGGPESPMTLPEFEEKFMNFAGTVLSPERAAQLWASGMQLGLDPDARFTDFTAQLIGI